MIKHLGMFLAVLLLPPQQPQVVRGRIEGSVLQVGTMEPIAGAKVTVTRVTASTGAAIATAGTLQAYLINPSPNVALPNVPGAPGPAGQPGAPPPVPPRQPLP